MATEAETKEPMSETVVTNDAVNAIQTFQQGKLENDHQHTGNGTNSEEVSEIKVETEMEAAEEHAMDINQKITADKNTFKDITDVTEANTEEKGNKSHDATVTDKLEEDKIEAKNENFKDENLNYSISGTKQAEKENTNGPTEINASNILKRETTEQEEGNLEKVIEGTEVEVQAGDIKMQEIESTSIAEPTEVEQKLDTNVFAYQGYEDENQNEDDEPGKGGDESNIDIGISQSPLILQAAPDHEAVSRSKNEREINETINYQGTTKENVQTEKTGIDNEELDVEAVESNKEYQKATSEDKKELTEDQLESVIGVTEIAEVNNTKNSSSEASRKNLDGDVGENDCLSESESKLQNSDAYEIAKEEGEVPNEDTKEDILESSSTTMEETAVKEDEEHIDETKDIPTLTKTTQVEYVQENGTNSLYDDQTNASTGLRDGLSQDEQKDKQDEITSLKIGNEPQTEQKLHETDDLIENSGANSSKDKESIERNKENSVENQLQQNAPDVYLDSLTAELEIETEGEIHINEAVQEDTSNASTGAPSISAFEVSQDQGGDQNAIDTKARDIDLATLGETLSSGKASQEMYIHDDHENKEEKLEKLLLKEGLGDNTIKKETGTGVEQEFYEASETMETNKNEAFKDSVAAEKIVEKETLEDPHFQENVTETESAHVNEMETEAFEAKEEHEDDNQNEDDESGIGGDESKINIGVSQSPPTLQETHDNEDISRTKNEGEIDESINYQGTTEENVQTEKTDMDNQELDVEAVEFDKEYQKEMSEDKEVLINDQLKYDMGVTEIVEVNNVKNSSSDSSESSRMNLDGDVRENDCPLESENKFESCDTNEIAKEEEVTVPNDDAKENILESSSTTMEETAVKEDEENIEESKDIPTLTKTAQVEYIQEHGINSSYDDQTNASISLGNGLGQDEQKDKQDEFTSLKIGNLIQTEPKLNETDDTIETSGANGFKDKESMERNTENSVEKKLQQNSSDVYLDSLTTELEIETEGEIPINETTVKEDTSNASTGAPSISAVEVSQDQGEEINAIDTKARDIGLATLGEPLSSDKASQEMDIHDDHEYKEEKLETILLKSELDDKSINKDTGTGAEQEFYEASETMEINENEAFKESVTAERNVEKETLDDPHFHENVTEAEDTYVNEMEKEALKVEKDKEFDDGDLKDTISNINENSNLHESRALITDEMDDADQHIADDLMKKPEKEGADNFTAEKDIDESLVVEKETTSTSNDTSTASESECKEKHEIIASSGYKELEDEQLAIEIITHANQESFNISNANETEEYQGFEDKESTEENISEKEILEYTEHEKSPHVVLEDLETTTETKDIRDTECEKQGTNNEDNGEKFEASVHSNTEAIPSNSDNLTELVSQLPNEAANSNASLKTDSESEKNRNIDTDEKNEKFEDTAQEKENDKPEWPQPHVTNDDGEPDENLIVKGNKIDEMENCSTKIFGQHEDTITSEPITESSPKIQSCSSVTFTKGHTSEEDCKKEDIVAEDDHLQEQMIEKKEERDDMNKEVKDFDLVSQVDKKTAQVKENTHCKQEKNSKVLASLEEEDKENRDNTASLRKEEIDENLREELDGNPQAEQICFESCNSSNICDNENFTEKERVSEEELKDQKPENISILVPENRNATLESAIGKETTELNDEKHVQKEEDAMLVESAIVEESGSESNTMVYGTNGAKEDELASQIDIEKTHAEALNVNEDPFHKNTENENRVFDKKILSEASEVHENKDSIERDLIVEEPAKIVTASEEKDQDEEHIEESEMINENMNDAEVQGSQLQNESLGLETAFTKDDMIETDHTELQNDDKAELDVDVVPVVRVENNDQLTKQSNMLSNHTEMETDDSFSKISNYWPINYNDEALNVNILETEKLDEKSESSLQPVHDKDMLQEPPLQEPELNQSEQVIETEQLKDTKASAEVENDNLQEENLPFSQFLMKHILTNESDSSNTSYDEKILNIPKHENDKQEDDIDISKEVLVPSSTVEQLHHASIADNSAGSHEKLQENIEVQVDDKSDLKDNSEVTDNKKEMVTPKLPISVVEQTQYTSTVEDKAINERPEENNKVRVADDCDARDNSEVTENRQEPFTMESPIPVVEQTQHTSPVEDKTIDENVQKNTEIQVDDKCDVKNNSEFIDNNKESFTTQSPISVIEQTQSTSIAEDKANNQKPQGSNKIQLDDKCNVNDDLKVADDKKESSTVGLPITVDKSMMEQESDSCIHNEEFIQNDVDTPKQEDLSVLLSNVQQNGKPKDDVVAENFPNSYDPVQAEKKYGVASDSESNFVKSEDREENISNTLSEKSIPAAKDEEDIELISTGREIQEIKEDKPNLAMDEQISEISLDDIIAEKKILHRKDSSELKSENSEIIEEEKQEQMLKNGLKDEIIVAGLQEDQQTNIVVEPEAAYGEINLECNQDMHKYEKENEKEEKKFEAPTLSEDKVNLDIKPAINVDDNQGIYNQKNDSTEELRLLESQKVQEVDENNTDDEEDENKEVDEHNKGNDSNLDETTNVKSRETDVTPTKKKSHGILSGVGSKVKRSIIKVRKAITGKSSYSETPTAK